MSPPDLSAAVDAILAARAELARLDETLRAAGAPEAAHGAPARDPQAAQAAQAAQGKAGAETAASSRPSRAKRARAGIHSPGPAGARGGGAEIPAFLPAPAKPPAPRPPKPAAPARDPLFANGVEITFGPDADVTYAERTTEITERQAELLAVLAPAMPLPVGRDFIAGKLWASPPTHADVMLGEIASSLKAALPGIGLQLKTVRGVGIALQPLEG
ncbi:MAG: hypothetical protein M5U08_13855 [Burkholderiales bacterium]|nr:hypothetical protein [Burkholderiales bacterium]